MSFLGRNASLCKRSDNTARSLAGGRTNSGRGQPTSRNNGPKARYRQQAKSSKEAGCATYACANAGALILILLWGYYSAQIFLFGAELTRSIERPFRKWR